MDMELNKSKNYVTFVWTLTDPNTARQMYLNRKKFELRPADKDEEEDVAISSHMVIDLGVPQNHKRYPVALEDHEHLSRSRIQKFLQDLMVDHMPPVTAVISEGVEKSGPPKVIMDAHPGRIMSRTDLAPAEIDLVLRTPRRAMVADDVDPYRQVVERRVFKLVRDGPMAELRQAAVDFVTQLRQKFPKHVIRVRWRDPDEPQRAEVTKVDPLQRPEALLERALTRTIHLTGFRGLPDATEKIVTRLATRMLEELRRAIAEDARRS